MHVHTEGSGTGYTIQVHTAGAEEGYTLPTWLVVVGRWIYHAQLHIYTAGDGNGYTLTTILLVGERDTSCTSNCWWWKGIHIMHVQLLVDTTCTSILLVMEVQGQQLFLPQKQVT
jgi:hypothetical protein